MLEAVIFDMDGVLIDSVASAHRVKRALLLEYGIDINTVPDPHNEQHRGASIDNLLSAVALHHGVHINHSEFSQKAAEGVYADLRKNNISVDPSLLRFLESLKDHAIPLAVATSAVRISTENKLRILGIADYFQTIITGNDVKQHKPHPEAYRRAIAQLGANPQRCVVFEDSVAGATAGQASGAVVVGITKYSKVRTPLVGATMMINDWDEISYQSLLDLVN